VGGATFWANRLRDSFIFISAERKNFCFMLSLPQKVNRRQRQIHENIFHTPFPENQPLGGLNRARKAVYPPLTELRQELNKAAKKEV